MPGLLVSANERFMPHGMCFLRNAGLLALHVASDAVIALAYYSIPLILLSFIRKRGNLPFAYGTTWDVTDVRVLAEQLRIAAARDRATAATLREKKRLMAMAEQLAHIGHWRLDAQSNEVFWSDELYRTFGLPTTFKPTLQNAIAVYHPDDRERVSAVVGRAIAAGMPYSSESRIVRPEGSIRHIISNGQPEYAADGTTVAVFGVFQDVTEGKEVERERLRLLERVRVAAQAGNVGIWNGIWLLTPSCGTRRCLVCTGYRNNPSNKPPIFWKRAFHPEDEEPATRAIADAIQRRTLLDVEYRLLWPNGETRHLRCRGMVRAAEAVSLPACWGPRSRKVTLCGERESTLAEHAGSRTLYATGDANFRARRGRASDKPTRYKPKGCAAS